MTFPLDVELADLRRRHSEKWTAYPDHVLPLFVAESDVLLAEPIRERLAAAIADGDTGYASELGELRAAVADFYTEFGVRASDGDVTPVVDVGVGIRAILRAFLPAGSRVIHHTPVYMPFPTWIRRAGHTPEAHPFADDGSIDLAAIDAALGAGARAMLLCHPHNPSGRIHPPEELAELATIAAKHHALVISDEIWAPLALHGRDFRSFLAASNTACKVGFAVSSASKTWNLAGLKSAFVVTGNRQQFSLPPFLAGSTGHLGALAHRVALAEGGPWRAQLVSALSANADLLNALLAEHLPKAQWTIPEATYLGWLDLRGYPGLGDNPAAVFLEHADVALSPGVAFGPGGAGHARINFACNPTLLREAVAKLGRVAAAHSA